MALTLRVMRRRGLCYGVDGKGVEAVACEVAVVMATMSVLMSMLMAMMVGVGDDDGACDAKHVGSEGDGDDAMLIMVAATMMSRWPCRPWRWHGWWDGVVMALCSRSGRGRR